MSTVTMSGWAVKHGLAQTTLSLTPLPDIYSISCEVQMHLLKSRTQDA
jgi:hypothetical protein